MIPVFTSVVNVRSVRTKRSTDLISRKDRVSTGIQIGQLRPDADDPLDTRFGKTRCMDALAHGVYQNATTKAAVSTSKPPIEAAAFQPG